mmetsp:Transcript_12902/g.27398  ORF Transcript_12902/g.27398 Transcript_12902/m.27398 type:complete len:199 (+) Transcript_12902:641-1237(+)
MQCVKFVGQNAASFKRRRRLHQHAEMEKNLVKAAQSLSMTPEGNGHTCTVSRSMSTPSDTSDIKSNEAWLECFWEKEMGRFSRPRPLSHRSITTDEEFDRYRVLSNMILPGKKSLATALNRFPLPTSIVGDNAFLFRYHTGPTAYESGKQKVLCGHLRQCSSMESLRIKKDSSQRATTPQTQEKILSPVSAVRFQEDS